MTKNVYVVRYEDARVYSTARKAVEAVASQSWEVYTNETLQPDDGHHWPLNKGTVSKAITQLNKKGFLTLSDGNETAHIERREVL